MSGTLCGLINFLAITSAEKRNKSIFFFNIFISIVGASLIPLFLYLSNSKLLTSCKDCYNIYLVIFGYMLIASIFASRLIIQLGKKIFDLSDVQDLINNTLTEPDAVNDLPEKVVQDIESKLKKGDAKAKIDKKDAISEANILLANMQSSRYKYRTVTGVSKSTKINQDKVRLILNILEQKKVVEQTIINGKTYYYLTNIGATLSLIQVE